MQATLKIMKILHIARDTRTLKSGEIEKKTKNIKNVYQCNNNNKSSSAAGRTDNGLLTPSLRMDTPISGVST